MSDLTVQERLDALTLAGWDFAFDGCHKFYILDRQEAKVEAVDLDYSIYPAELLQEKWDESCGLRFINRWALEVEGNSGFGHEFAIEQGEWDAEDEDEDEEDF